MRLEKNERESTKLLCFYSQSQDWLIHFQELDIMLGTKFLQKGAGSFNNNFVCWRTLKKLCGNDLLMVTAMMLKRVAAVLP